MAKKIVRFRKVNPWWHVARENLRNAKSLIAIVGILAVLISVFMIFFYSQNCSDEQCFKNAMAYCARASYSTANENSSWRYTVDGISLFEKGDCKMTVKNLNVVGDRTTVDAMKGREMTCFIPMTDVSQGIMPDQRIELCHGYLKEGLQDLIIIRIHAYLIQNLAVIQQSAVGL